MKYMTKHMLRMFITYVPDFSFSENKSRSKAKQKECKTQIEAV